jgi:uncharacterized delta-60 repeat protein
MLITPIKISAGVSFMLGALALGAEYRIDNTYATNGFFRQVGYAANGVIAQTGGKILIGTSMVPPNASLNSFALLRQNSNGALDTTFDGDGIQYTDFGSSSQAYVYGMAESPLDGKIYLVGEKAQFVSSVYQSDFAVACFNADGSPNTDFNVTGKTTSSFNDITNGSRTFPYGASGAECVAVQADGKVVVGGWVYVANNDRRFALIRYNTNGSIDFGFGSGLVVTNPGSYCSISAIAISPVDQKIVAVGRYQEPQSPWGYYNMVVRYNTDGTLDTDFDTDGKVFTGGGGTNNDPESVAVQADGKIVVGGSSYVKNPFSEPTDFALFRYSSDGSLDSGFGTGGMTLVDEIGGHDAVRAIKLQSNGKILAAGTVGGDPNDTSAVSSLALLMFNSDGTLDTSFNTDGMVSSSGTTSREAYCLAQQADGKIIVGGVFDGENSDPIETATTRFEAVPPVVVITRKTDLLLGLSANTILGSNIYNTTGAGQTLDFGLGNKTTKSAYFGIQNDGSAADSFKVKGTPGNSDFTVNYFKGSKNITAAIVAGTYQTSSLAVGATEIVKVSVTTNGARAAKKRTLTITASSVAKATASDTGLIKLTSKAKKKKKAN